MICMMEKCNFEAGRTHSVLHDAFRPPKRREFPLLESEPSTTHWPVVIIFIVAFIVIFQGSLGR